MVKIKRAGIKILFVTDLHLRDENTTSVLKMVENNRVIFEEILKVLREDPSICLVIFGGDIQDKNPKSLYEIGVWNKYFNKIAEIMRERIKDLPNLVVQGFENIVEDVLENRINFLPTIRGNHDMVKKLSKKISLNTNEDVERETHTYYDLLIEDRKMIEPKYIKFGEEGSEIFIDLRSYGEADRSLPPEASNASKVIVVFHDNVVNEDSTYWQKQDEKAYRVEDVMGEANLGIINHIHTPLEPIKIESEALPQQPVMWQIGSVGRMKFNKDEYRDYGYCGLYDVSTDSLTKVELELIPKDVYFDTKRAIKARKQREDYSSLKLKYEEVEVSDKNPIEALRESKRIEDEGVREVAIEIMKEVLKE